MANKILLALQYWEGDKLGALRLAKFLADIETAHSDLADFIIVRRFDCPEPKEYETLLPTLARKFNLFSYRSPRRGTGWPDGCNDLWFSTMEWAYSMIEAKKVPHYKAIFTFEADGAPLFQDWVSRMSKTWDQINAKRPVYMAGALVQHPAEHINGNALMSGDLKFLHWIVRTVGKVPVGSGWDFILANRFRSWGWANINEMRSYYNSKTFSDPQYEQMVREGLLWIHGGKDDSLVRRGYEKILQKSALTTAPQVTTPLLAP